MDVLPIALRLQGQRCLIIGGGGIARRKARLLLGAGARVDILAPQIVDDLRTDAEASQGQCHLLAYPSDQVQLRDYRLVIAATDDAAVNAQVFHDCEAIGVLVNSVDDPPHCRFIVPAIIDRSPLLVSVSTNGAAPVLARQLRTKIESLVPAQYGELAKFSGDWRQQVKAAIPVPDTRRIFWEDLYAGAVGEQVLSGQRARADAAMPQLLADWKDPKGEVYLVGSGPGDPDLLTFKALRLMQQADVVVYDRLVSKPIMNLVRRDAERIYVGKARSDHAVPQEGINALLVRLAQEGKRVCRLKGGDPFIFGRGGEEIEELVAAGVPFQVVPGITAAAGCGAYAGIPLTHRDYAQSVRFLTGHLKEGSPELPWSELVYEHQTLVLYMGLVGLERISAQLIAHGLRPDMPVALVSKGTTPDQRVVVGTVSDIASKVEGSGIAAPTIIIIGEVVKLRDKLRWFDLGADIESSADQ
jgi:uroporphyrin-III C-methyltransferase / precorrin-2 dehydrogenase / sirohydrochlorin ferrochelatase